MAAKAIVLYGRESLPWPIFAQAATNFALEMSSHPIKGSGVPGTDFVRDPLASFTRTVLSIEQTRADWRSARTVNLLSMLRKFRSREASDKRDKVFALLGLVNSWGHLTPLQADYALTTEEVLCNTTVKVIASMQSLIVLEGTLQLQRWNVQNQQTARPPLVVKSSNRPAMSGLEDKFARNMSLAKSSRSDTHSRREMHPMPSWIVDWTLPPSSTETERLSHLELFNAAAGLPGLLQLHGTSILEAQGFIFDEVAELGDPLAASGFARMRAMIMRWFDLIYKDHNNSATRAQFSSGNISRGSKLENFAFTICGGLLYEATSEQSKETSKSGAYRLVKNDDLRAFRDWSNPDRYEGRRTSIVNDTWIGWTNTEVNEKVSSLHFAIETSSTGRAFFVTKQGYMGLGPPETRVGDKVCVLLGARVPFVLRPSGGKVRCHGERLRTLARNPDGSKGVKQCFEQHGELFTLVGDAYVHHVMDGEVTRAVRRSSGALPSLFIE